MNYKIENGNITVRLADYIELLESKRIYLEHLDRTDFEWNYKPQIEELQQQINLLKEQL